jgi:hypothetical protein
MGSMPHDFALIVALTVKEDSSLPLALSIFIDHNLLSYTVTSKGHSSQIQHWVFQKSHSSKITLSHPNVNFSEIRHIKDVPHTFHHS